MSPSELMATYRLNAALCVEIANDCLESGRKIALLNMAQAWIGLAEQVGKVSGIALGVTPAQADPTDH